MVKAVFAFAFTLTAIWVALLLWLALVGLGDALGYDSIEQPNHAKYQNSPHQDAEFDKQ